MLFSKKIWLITLFFIAFTAKSQRTPIPSNGDCPPNIGFESGSFDFWECNSGSIQRDGSLVLSPTAPIPDRHTLLARSMELDPYGNFPVSCPNGSGYSIRLGNSLAGGQAESASYTFVVPAGKNDYSVLYNYAVVFQNPPHRPFEQPKFTSKVFNVTDGVYIDCGSFEYVASSSLPGFKLSGIGKDVFYKPWSPVTVNLIGLAGKTVRLEFTTNDCAFTQHFGYAYVDVNEDCSSEPITGNTYCGGAQSINLTAPFGFASYSWYTADFSQLLGSENILTLPPPPANTTYAVIITPYDGVGCLDTLYTTIHVSSEPFKLEVMTEIIGCPTGVDLTSPTITAGSTPGLTYSYFTDLTQTNYVAFPTAVTSSGIYYIKGVNRSGCNEIKPIKVSIIQPPNLVINNPAGTCMPQTVNITAPEITSGSELGLTYSYWQEIDALRPIANPAAITVSGTYYIRAIKPGSCGIVKPVEVKIGDIPTIVITDPIACGKIDLTDEDVTAGSTPGIFYSYWTDASATVALTNPENITKSGTYFLMASSNSGCSIIRSINATVNPIPTFTVIDPPPAVYPAMTIDLTTAVNHNIGNTYTYWLDSLTRKPVGNPRAVDKRGRYFIRATNEFGCVAIKAVNAVIVPPPEPIVYIPTAFTPNNDGLNDGFKIKIIGETSVSHFRIYNRWGQIVYENSDMNKTWNGKLKGVELPSGVYIWMMDGIDTYFKKPFTQKGLVTLIR